MRGYRGLRMYRELLLIIPFTAYFFLLACLFLRHVIESIFFSLLPVPVLCVPIGVNFFLFLPVPVLYTLLAVNSIRFLLVLVNSNLFCPSLSSTCHLQHNLKKILFALPCPQQLAAYPCVYLLVLIFFVFISL